TKYIICHYKVIFISSRSRHTRFSRDWSSDVCSSDLNAHASYYADKFNGRRTASGRKFDNSKYTAAHRKLPFGTMLRVTNESSGLFVDVEVTDRGPFTKGREIDLSKKAFMDIARNKNRGALQVTIEIIE